jgi:hypothetical protein
MKLREKGTQIGKGREERLWLDGANLFRILFSFSRLLLYAWNMEYPWKGKEKEKESEVLGLFGNIALGVYRGPVAEL